MAEEETKETQEENKEQTNENGEVVGEFGVNSKKKAEDDADKPIEFTPLDLGTEGNVSDWIVNMLSGRALDFVVKNVAWAGDFLHRHVGVRVEKYIEKRQAARQIKETEKANNVAKDQAKARQKITDKNGNIDISKANSISANETNGLVSVGDYVLKPDDKVVDSKGQPFQINGSSKDIVNRWETAIDERTYNEALAKEDKAKSAKQEAEMKRKSGALRVSQGYNLYFNSKGEIYQVGDYVVKPGDKLVDAMGKPLTGKNADETLKQIGDAAIKREAINEKRRKTLEENKKKNSKGKSGKETAEPEKKEPSKTGRAKKASKKTPPAPKPKREKSNVVEKAQQSQARAKKTTEATKSAKTTKSLAKKLESDIAKTQDAKNKVANRMNKNKTNAGNQAAKTANRSPKGNQGR